MLTVRVGRIKPKTVLSRSDICEVKNSESQGVGVVPHIIRIDWKKSFFSKKNQKLNHSAVGVRKKTFVNSEAVP